MISFKRALVTLAVTAGLVAGGAVAAAPANAMAAYNPRTVGCGAGKTAQIDWTSTGNVKLFVFPSNQVGWGGETLVREVTANGSYSYNSGRSTLTWGFGAASGNVSSFTERCVSFSR